MELITSTYQVRLQELLQASTLTPARYTPSEAVMTGTHMGVFVGSTPVLLTGPSDDEESIQQAIAFTKSKAFRHLCHGLQLDGDISAKSVRGADIAWPAECDCVSASESGKVESGGDGGPLMVLCPSNQAGLSTLLCVNTELARIIDPKAPELDSGMELAELVEHQHQADVH